MANLIHVSVVFPAPFSPIPWDSSGLTSCISELLPKVWCQTVRGLKSFSHHLCLQRGLSLLSLISFSPPKLSTASPIFSDYGRDSPKKAVVSSFPPCMYMLLHQDEGSIFLPFEFGLAFCLAMTNKMQQKWQVVTSKTSQNQLPCQKLDYSETIML